MHYEIQSLANLAMSLRCVLHIYLISRQTRVNLHSTCPFYWAAVTFPPNMLGHGKLKACAAGTLTLH